MALSKAKLMLAKALDQARMGDEPILNDADVLRTFGPEDLMHGFRDEVEKRAEIIERSTGMKKKLALGMPIELAAQTLSQALAPDVAVTDATEIFSVVSAEDLVRTQDPKRVWQLVYGNGWLLTDAPLNKAYMKFLLTEIIEHDLLGPNTPLGVFSAIGPLAFVSDRMPEEDSAALLLQIMIRGEPLLRTATPDSSSLNSDSPRPFTAKHLIESVSIEKLVEHNPLSLLAKVLEDLAKTHGWVEAISSLTDRPPPSEEDGSGDLDIVIGTESEAPPAAVTIDFTDDEEEPFENHGGRTKKSKRKNSSPPLPNKDPA